MLDGIFAQHNSRADFTLEIKVAELALYLNHMVCITKAVVYLK